MTNQVKVLAERLSSTVGKEPAVFFKQLSLILDHTEMTAFTHKLSPKERALITYIHTHMFSDDSDPEHIYLFDFIDACKSLGLEVYFKVY